MSFAGTQWQPITGFAWLFLEGAVSALVYFVAFYWSGLAAAERDLITGKLRRMLGRGRPKAPPPSQPEPTADKEPPCQDR